MGEAEVGKGGEGFSSKGQLRVTVLFQDCLEGGDCRTSRGSGNRY